MNMIHATCVVVGGAGVLLRGPSGSGKSDLALRLIDGGAALVADDRVLLARENGRLVGRAPPAIAGLLEVRGLGLVPVTPVPAAEIDLVVDLRPCGAIERLPEPAWCAYLGVRLPLVALEPFHASATAKVRFAATRWAGKGRLAAGEAAGRGGAGNDASGIVTAAN
jgi:serine kinase of HPr protein (carbohydrate metabolism regulator)